MSDLHDENIARVTRRELFELRRNMGMLFQSSALFTDLSVFENVAFPLRRHTKKTDAEIREFYQRNRESFDQPARARVRWRFLLPLGIALFAAADGRKATVTFDAAAVVDRVRQAVSPCKISVDRWLEPPVAQSRPKTLNRN